MRSRLRLFFVFTTTILDGQQSPFVPVTGPNAPQGATVLFEDSRGGLWLAGTDGGRAGLTYFDGSRFVRPSKIFPTVFVSGMAEDSGGGIWIASSGGVYRLFKDRLEKVAMGSASLGITKIAADVFLTSIAMPGGDPYGNADMVRITQERSGWRSQTISKMPQGASFEMDHLGNVLYPCSGGYCELPGDQVTSWRNGSVLAVRRHPISHSLFRVISRDRFGCLWIPSLPNATYQCPGDGQPRDLPRGAGGFGQRRILELSDGSVAVASIDSLGIGRPRNFRVLTRANGYPSAASVLLTKDGSIWLSNANGLFVLGTCSKSEFWTERDGLDGNTWSILRIGDAVFAIAGETVRVLDAGRSRWRPLLAFGGTKHLSAGPNNTILASSFTGGVVQMSQTGKILRRSGPAEGDVVARTSDGRLWLTGNGVSKINLDGRRLNLEPQEIPSLRSDGLAMFDMKVDERGGLWTCDASGFVHMNEAGWHRLSNGNGLLENQYRSLAIDKTGDAWYAYNTIPAFSLIQNVARNRPLIRHFTEGSELGSAQSNFFASDRRGWLWRGTEDGIYVADLEQARRGQWLHLNQRDGLPSTDSNRRSFFEDSDGSVWFGAGTTITHLFPSADLVHPKYAPSVFVSGFSLNGGVFQRGDVVDEIKHDSKVVAHIGSLQFDRRNALRLRYRLLPEQRAWIVQRDLDIGLGTLHWGEHTLEVQARLYTGPWSSTVSKSFTILKPLWLTWPALLGFAATGGFAAASGYGWRRKRRRRSETELPGLADWRVEVLSPQIARFEGTLLDGRFEVGRTLARGGFATVFEGRDLEGNKPCAIKVFRHELTEKSWMARRFEQEVSALQKIRHPNVVRIYGHGEVPSGSPYLAMELIVGRTLREALNETKLDRQQVARYVRQAGDALAEIHSYQIRHRDLKPENLMIREPVVVGKELVLIDFSIAIVQDPDETLHGLSRAAGSPQYMAPEQAIGYADSSTDIYSLAKIVLEMLTGHRLAVLLPDASMDLPTRIRDLLTNTPYGLSASSINLIAAALEFDPSRRPKAAGEFGKQLSKDLADAI